MKLSLDVASEEEQTDAKQKPAAESTEKEGE